jgi:hypothetical protein
VGLPYRAVMSRGPALLTAILAVSRTIDVVSLGSFFDQVTELVKIPEDALKELDNGIDQ